MDNLSKYVWLSLYIIIYYKIVPRWDLKTWGDLRALDGLNSGNFYVPKNYDSFQSWPCLTLPRNWYSLEFHLVADMNQSAIVSNKTIPCRRLHNPTEIIKFVFPIIVEVYLRILNMTYVVQCTYMNAVG